MVYTVGPQADPRGVVRQITEALSRLGIGTFAANHEFMNSQYEINLRHAPALTAADRAFRLKAPSRTSPPSTGCSPPSWASRSTTRAARASTSTSRSTARTTTRSPTITTPDGVSAELRHFTAGILDHAHALTAFLNPTINAYRRLVPDSLAPTHANWGWDNRTSFIRIPAERGRASRVEVRVGDGSANPYLASAALLFAGLHGVREKLPLGPPSAATRTRSTTPASPSRSASGTRSTRSRPTRCCATRWARRSSTPSWPSSASSSSGTASGCRTGSSTSTSITSRTP